MRGGNSVQREAIVNRTTNPLDEALKTVQLETAQADLKLKEMEIRSKQGLLKGLLTNPILIGAFLTAYVTIASSYFTWVNSRAQTKLEEAKFESSVILEVIKSSDPDKAAVNLEFLRDTGILPEYLSFQLKKYLNQRVPHTGASLPQKP